jgi:P27 family predicted phage terminase small subunit
MMKSPRGRKPKPPELKEALGNPGNRPIPEPAIKVKGTKPIIPDHLDDEAKACMEMIQRSMPADVYQTIDTFALTSFAVLWSLHRQAVIALNLYGPVIEGKDGEKMNPWFRVMSDCAGKMKEIGSRLGLDPVARASLVLPSDKPKGKFDGLLGGDLN